MRDKDRIDRCRIDAGGLHVAHHLAGRRLHLTAGAAVAQDGLAAVFDHDNGERDRDKISRESGLDHRLFDVVDRRVGDEGRVVRLLPDAGNVGGADLVWNNSLGRIGGFLGKRRHHQPGIEAERGGKAGRHDKVTT